MAALIKIDQSTLNFSHKLGQIYPAFKDLDNIILYSVSHYISQFLKSIHSAESIQIKGQVKKAHSNNPNNLDHKEATKGSEVKPKLIFGQNFLWKNLTRSINANSILKELSNPTYNICQQKFEYISNTYVRCLDCDLTTDPVFHGIMCLDCYSKSNHKGHNVLYSELNDLDKFCDCGDYTVFDEKGFCSSHGKNPLITRDKILEMIPSNLKIAIQDHFYEAFYGLFAVLETMIQFKDQLLKDYKYVPTQIFKEILNFINYLLEKHSTMKYLVNEILLGSLPIKFNKLRHNCEDTNNVQIRIGNELVNCKCTILENIIRYQCLYSDENCSNFNWLIDKLRRDKEFELCLLLTYIKMYHLSFYSIVRNQKYGFSILNSMTKILSKSLIIMKNIAASLYLTNLFDIYDMFFDNFDHICVIVFNFISNILIKILDSQEIINTLLKDTNFLEKYIHFIERFWFKYVFNIDQLDNNDSSIIFQTSKEMSKIIDIEGDFLNLYEKLLQMIEKDNIALFDKILSTLSQILYNGIVCRQEQNDKSKSISACNISPRLFIMTYRFLYDDINNDNIESFFIRLFNNQDKMKWTTFWSTYLLETIKYMMISKYLKKKGYGYLWSKYIFPNGQYRKYDILFCQMAILCLDQNSIYDILFNYMFYYGKIEAENNTTPINQVEQSQIQEQVHNTQQESQEFQHLQQHQELPQQHQEEQVSQQSEQGQQLQQEQRLQQQPQENHVLKQLHQLQEIQGLQLQKQSQQNQQPQQDSESNMLILSYLMLKKIENMDNCKQKGLDLVDDWLELLILIMNDELSYCNTNPNKNTITSVYKKIANNCIISLLKDEWLSSMDYHKFYGRLKYNLVNYNKLENNNEVYTIHSHWRKIELKEKYRDSYDFFFTYNTNSISLFNEPNLIENINLSMAHFIQRKNLPYATKYILQVQEKIFSSKLPSEIMRLITIYKNYKDKFSSQHLPNVYRIIHMHLDAIFNPNIIIDKSKIIQNFKEIYMLNKDNMGEVKSYLESKLMSHYKDIQSSDIEILINRMNNEYLIQQQKSGDISNSLNKNNEFDEVDFNKQVEKNRLIEKKKGEILRVFKNKQEKAIKAYFDRQEAKNKSTNNISINPKAMTNSNSNKNANLDTNTNNNTKKEALTDENKATKLSMDLPKIQPKIINNIFNSEEDATCLICNEKIQKKTFVAPLYIDQSNFDNNLDKYISYNICIDAPKDPNITDYKASELIFKDTNPEINKYSGCWHPYHHKCLLKFSACQYCNQKFDAKFYIEEYPDIKWIERKFNKSKRISRTGVPETSLLFNSICPFVDKNDKIPKILNIIRKMIIGLLYIQPVIIDYKNYINKSLYLSSILKNELIKYLIYLCRFYLALPIFNTKAKKQNIFKYFNLEFDFGPIEKNNTIEGCDVKNEEGKSINKRQKAEIKTLKKSSVTTNNSSNNTATLKAKPTKVLVSSVSQKALIASRKLSLSNNEAISLKSGYSSGSITGTTKNLSEKKGDSIAKIPVSNSSMAKSQLTTKIAISNTQNTKTLKPIFEKSASQKTLTMRSSTANINKSMSNKAKIGSKSTTARSNTTRVKNTSSSTVSVSLTASINTPAILLEPSFDETVNKESESITMRDSQINLSTIKPEEEEDEKENIITNLPKSSIQDSYINLNLESIIEEEPVNALNTIKLTVDFPQDNNTTMIIQEKKAQLMLGDIQIQEQPSFLEKTVVQNGEDRSMIIELWNGDINSQYAEHFYNYYITKFIRDKIVEDKYDYHNLSFIYPTYYLYIVFLKFLPEIFTEEHFVELDANRVKSMLFDIKEDGEKYNKFKVNLLKACKFLLPLTIFYENSELTLKKSAPFDLNDLDKLICFVIPDLTLSTLIDVIYPKYIDQENHIFNTWKSILHHNIKNNKSILTLKTFACISTIIDLPPNLYEFNQKYQQSKCEIHGVTNKKLLLCLLCGHICCAETCNYKDNIFFYMYDHNKNIHANQGIWLNLSTLYIVVYIKKFGKVRFGNQIYLNNYGKSQLESLNIRRLDCKTFKLDYEIINIIKCSINEGRFNHQIQNFMSSGLCHTFYKDLY